MRTELRAGLGLAEQRRHRPRMGSEQPPVGAGEGAQVLEPVVRGRRWLEAAEHAVQQGVDQALLGGEVVVESHRHGPELRRHGAHG